MIYKKEFLSAFIVFFLFFVGNYSAFALEKGSLEYNDNFVDYSKLSPKEFKHNGDYYFVLSQRLTSEYKKKDAETNALGEYFVLTKINSNDPYAFVQMGRIYTARHQDILAKENFFRALNISSYDPYANYFFGEYYYYNHDYRRALKYYLVAYDNGYSNVYDLNLKLAKLYEKLGDMGKAKELYLKSYSIKGSDVDFQEKNTFIN